MPESPIRHSGWPARIQAAFGQGVDQAGVDQRVGGEVEVVEAFRAGEPGLADQPGLAAVLAFVAFHGQQLDQEALVAGLLPGGGLGDPRVVFADGGQPQDPAGLLDRRVGGGVGELVATGRPGHQRRPSTAGLPGAGLLGSAGQQLVVVAHRRRRPAVGGTARGAGGARPGSPPRPGNAAARFACRVASVRCRRRRGVFAGLDGDRVGGHRARRPARRGSRPAPRARAAAGAAAAPRSTPGCRRRRRGGARAAAQNASCAGGEPARGAGLGQRGRAGQRARLAEQDLQVVVQLEPTARRG